MRLTSVHLTRSVYCIHSTNFTKVGTVATKDSVVNKSRRLIETGRVPGFPNLRLNSLSIQSHKRMTTSRTGRTLRVEVPCSVMLSITFQPVWIHSSLRLSRGVMSGLLRTVSLLVRNGFLKGVRMNVDSIRMRVRNSVAWIRRLSPVSISINSLTILLISRTGKTFQPPTLTRS